MINSIFTPNRRLIYGDGRALDKLIQKDYCAVLCLSVRYRICVWTLCVALRALGSSGWYKSSYIRHIAIKQHLSLEFDTSNWLHLIFKISNQNFWQFSTNFHFHSEFESYPRWARKTRISRRNLKINTKIFWKVYVFFFSEINLYVNFNCFFFHVSGAKKEKKNKDVSRAYLKEAEKLKQRYEAKSPELMKHLEEMHKIRKIQQEVFAKLNMD